MIMCDGCGGWPFIMCWGREPNPPVFFADLCRYIAPLTHQTSAHFRCLGRATCETGVRAAVHESGFIALLDAQLSSVREHVITCGGDDDDDWVIIVYFCHHLVLPSELAENADDTEPWEAEAGPTIECQCNTHMQWHYLWSQHNQRSALYCNGCVRVHEGTYFQLHHK